MRHFKDKVCLICGSQYNVEAHHIFGASNRNKSEADGLVVYLCAEHHREGRYSAHQSADAAKQWHIYGQTMWLLKNPDKTIRDFRLRYGKNYLGDWEI